MHDEDKTVEHELKKFTASFEVNDWEIETPEGFKEIRSVHQTVPYDVYKLKTPSYELRCADKHVVFREDGREVFVADLIPGDQIQTQSGPEVVASIEKLDRQETMYDVQVNSFSQQYFSNGIVSHNTACAALYLLWYAMFNPNVNVLVAAHKGSGASEIMDRIRYAYEECPDHIRCGVTTYASSKIVFDNKSSIVAQTTTENTGRGLSISLLYCLDAGTVVRVRDKETLEEKDITLEALYTELNGEELVHLRKQPMVRLIFEDGYYVDAPETHTFVVNDIKTTIENMTQGDEILIGNYYFKLVDIQALE